LAGYAAAIMILSAGYAADLMILSAGYAADKCLPSPVTSLNLLR
jgi:hypothetical protein